MTEDERVTADVRLMVDEVLPEKIRVLGDPGASEAEWKTAYGAFAALNVVLRLADAGCQDEQACYCALITRVGESELSRAGDDSAAQEEYEALVARSRSRARTAATAGLRHQVEARRDEAQTVCDGSDDQWSVGVAAAYQDVLDVIDGSDSSDRAGFGVERVPAALRFWRRTKLDKAPFSPTREGLDHSPSGVTPASSQ